MLISLLLIIVPTILTLAVLIPFINSRNKRILDEIGELKAQLEQKNILQAPENTNVVEEPEQPEPEIQVDVIEEKEEQDAGNTEITEPQASAYNTGKSGKIYTKEELELLIKE